MTSAFLQSLDAPAREVLAVEQPTWLAGLRARAASRFAEIGLPTTRDEDWKFTSVAAIGQGTFAIPEPGSYSTDIASGVQEFRAKAPDWYEVVYLNGRYAPHLSRGDLPPGVRVLSMADAFLQEQDLLQARLGAVADYQYQAFTALNTALMSDGAVRGAAFHAA